MNEFWRTGEEVWICSGEERHLCAEGEKDTDIHSVEIPCWQKDGCRIFTTKQNQAARAAVKAEKEKIIGDLHNKRKECGDLQ
jgi:hypothetical protein